MTLTFAQIYADNLVPFFWVCGMIAGLVIAVMMTFLHGNGDTPVRLFLLDTCLRVATGVLLGPVFVAFVLGRNHQRSGNMFSFA